MVNLTRRRLLQATGAVGAASLVSTNVTAMEMEGPTYGEHSSPDLDKYVHELPVPEVRDPDGKRFGVDYHEVTVEESTHRFHPDLPETTIWGFDGQFPGPVIAAKRWEPIAVEFDNGDMPDEHLFDVDTRIDGTTTENYHDYAGPVPEVRTVTHFHGLKVDPANDGQADMWTSPGGVEGPRFSNDVQWLANRQNRLTSTYHDHARGISRLNNYAGLVGHYRIESWREKWLDLPDDEYDVPLVLADRSFTEDGELFYPGMFMANVAGDTATVNGAAWPRMTVEPRRYRFHVVNASNGRTYDLGLVAGDPDDGHDEDGGAHTADDGHDVPSLYQISAGHGFLEEVVEIGHDGDMESLVLSPFERAEIVVDFSEYAGETFTVTNDAAFPYGGGHGGGDHGGHSTDTESDDGHDDGGMDMPMDPDHPEITEIMQFHVTETASGRDRSAPVSELSLPSRSGTDPSEAETTRKVTMQMGMDDEELMIHTLNGKRWGDPIEYKPTLGSTEIWELENTDDHTHPIHLHLVEFDVIDRERHDSDEGPHPPKPNERGGLDIVRVDPGETVRIAVTFDGYAGKFPFHCHILEHEEHDMMRMFEVVEAEDCEPWEGWFRDDCDPWNGSQGTGTTDHRGSWPGRGKGPGRNGSRGRGTGPGRNGGRGRGSGSGRGRGR
ncbi:multicopper oxidase family protein [Halovivax cerinus]|uniref:Multicopper oxidase family protein n=1 Tax=Halovivax cerinus TaxID=1487865 RepID=A0ABD5NTX1_9EURY|nr:multicopper oxidase domain-containing protein [Halovivax cerinus]